MILLIASILSFQIRAESILNILNKNDKTVQNQEISSCIDEKIKKESALKKYVHEFRANLNIKKEEEIEFKKKIKIAVIDTGVDMNLLPIQAVVTKSVELDVVKYTRLDRLPSTLSRTLTKDFDWIGSGHGTHVTGIIAGLMPVAEIIVIKPNYSQTFTEAIEFALNEGVDIINISGGGITYSQEEYDVLAKTKEKGVLVVAAVGNLGTDLKILPYYPASYNLDNIISVGGLEEDYANILNDGKDPVSNYGEKVDFYTRGRNVVSLGRNKEKYVASGTSIATPIISAIAGQIWASNPNLKYNEVKEEIKKHATKKIINAEQFVWSKF